MKPRSLSLGPRLSETRPTVTLSEPKSPVCRPSPRCRTTHRLELNDLHPASRRKENPVSPEDSRLGDVTQRFWRERERLLADMRRGEAVGTEEERKKLLDFLLDALKQVERVAPNGSDAITDPGAAANRGRGRESREKTTDHSVSHLRERTSALRPRRVLRANAFAPALHIDLDLPTIRWACRVGNRKTGLPDRGRRTRTDLIREAAASDTWLRRPATDALIEQLIENRRELERECAALRHQLSGTESELARVREREQLVSKALRPRRPEPQQSKTVRDKEAEAILSKARIESEWRMERAGLVERKREETERELERLLQLQQAVRAGLISFLTEAVEQLRSDGESNGTTSVAHAAQTADEVRVAPGPTARPLPPDSFAPVTGCVLGGAVSPTVPRTCIERA